MKQATLTRPKTDDDRYQAILSNDSKFLAWVSSCEHLDEALEQAYKFHLHIANQLVRRGISSPNYNEWARRTFVLADLAADRCEYMQKLFIRIHGQSALKAELDHLDNLYPRAIWGEGK